MNYILLVFLVLGLAFFLRGIFVARGILKKKLFLKESFLFWQKATAFVYLATIILAILALAWQFLTIAVICEFLNFLFYLQPTPRISKIISYFIIMTYIGFVLYFVVK